MIYLDTSAFIKLYIREEYSKSVNDAVTSQDEPLPFCFLHRVEMRNALNLKLFREEITTEDVDRLIQLMQDRLQAGIYASPHLGLSELTSTAVELTRHTSKLGCRSLDILHVAAAKLLKPDQFVTFDDRQQQLAQTVGLPLTDMSM